MKVALVCPYGLSAPGGVQRQVLDLAGVLRSAGHEATVIAPDAKGYDDTIDVGRTLPVRANGSVAPISLLPRGHRNVTAALSAADVIHIHEPFMPMLGWLTLRARRPRVLTFHADPSGAARMAYRRAKPLLRRAIRSTDVATAVSETAASAVRHLFGEMSEVPNGLDVDSFRSGTDRNPVQVAFLGRSEPRKGLDLLLEAWPRVSRAVTGARLVVMGATQPEYGENVSFVGRVGETEKREILAASAAFCAPNRGGESFGITVVEGMAAGCAIVASDLAAFEAVLAGSGVTFENGNAMALSESLISVLSDPELTARLAVASQTRVLDFDWGRVAARYVGAYESAMERFSAASG